MIELNPLLIQSIFKSSLPLLLGGSYHLLKALLSTLGVQKASKYHDDLLQSHGINQNNGMSSEEPRPDLLTLLNQVSFGVYTNLFTFLFAMFLIELFMKIAQKGIQEGFWKDVKSLRSRPRTLSLDFHAQEWKFFNLISEIQMKRIFSYLVIFMFLQIIGLFSSFVVQSEISTNMTRHPALIASQNQMNLMNHYDVPRILEEDVKEQQILSSSVAMTPDKISLSMGSVLGSLNLNVNAMVLSKDKKTAFVTIDLYGYLKIIDISDLQSPFVLGSLNLRVSIGDYSIKSLILSSDEKTLYTSNTMNLEIIDVTDLSLPKLISETSSELFNANSYEELSTDFKTSLAVSECTKTLYIGGLGLQVYDISDPKEPVLLKAFKNNPKEYNYVLERNEICLSRDEKTLFIANGTLDVYNISNPKEMKLLYSFKTESSPRSLLLLEASKTVLLLGSSDDGGIIFEEVDISSLGTFKVKKTLKLDGWTSNNSPRFLAISPSRSKVFIFADSGLEGSTYLLVFDRIKETTRNTGTKLIEQTFAMEFSADGKILITGSNNQFRTIELFLDYPNNQIFSTSQENLVNNISLPLCDEMEMSGDAKYLFALCKKQGEGFSYFFSIWDVKNLSAPRSLYDPQVQISGMHFTKNYQTVYLVGSSSIMVLDITNRDESEVKRTYELEDRETIIRSFIVSSDEKTGFIIRSVGSTRYVSFIDLSSSAGKVNILLTLDIEFKLSSSGIVLKDDKTLILLTQKMTIYDISELSSPKQIASLPFGVNEPDPDLNSYVLSADSKILFIDTVDHHRFHKLKIYNISISASPQLISEKYVPRVPVIGYRLSVSSDLKTGYLYQPDSLIKLNLTDLTFL